MHFSHRTRGWFALALLAVLFVATPAAAHRLGESYLMLSSYEDRLEGRVEIQLTDLNAAIPLDQDRDGKFSDEEFAARVDEVKSYLQSHVRLFEDGRELLTEYGEWRVTDLDLGRFAVMEFLINEPVAETVEIEYTALFDQLPEHRGLLIVEFDHESGVVNDTEIVSLVFSPSRSRQTIDPEAQTGWATFVAFVREGIHHIWIGVDHILFLIALILPSVLRRRDGKWVAVEGFRPALFSILKVVTIFTIAHSITLSLAALGILEMNSRWVESIIAASVVVAAISGGFLGKDIWPAIFLFGLFHGFGFASVLGHLAIDRRVMVPTLVGFNVGVEIGQIAIMCMAFPVLWFLRNWRGYTPVVLRTGSSLIAALAFVWLLERALDVTILGIF